ncbi:DUF1559 domain-containing protein [uncultured Gimesia sp.]|uniref:DUF1559 family PulG-like putative transporter n=1 Tax=uncultured Gimesia sp. TaxID=1678688 RepID=UPI0030D742CE|tara:strand:- start:37 stop:807 length:771 start_codon:yes stop_codon:yes gene_type:complete
MNAPNEMAPDKDKKSITRWLLDHKAILLIVVLITAFAVHFVTLLNRAVAKQRAINQLRHIGLAAINYSSGAAGNFPMGGTTDQAGNPQHGWMTTILPFMKQGILAEQINYDKPWTAPENEHVFKTMIPAYLNPEIHDPLTNSKGYALSHYAANPHVFGINKSANIGTIGLAGRITNTILMGEINANYPAWGSTKNMRDPAKGLNGGPDRFGSPSGEGATVIFVDGSGKFLNKNISPLILKAISNPTGKGPVPPNAF